MSYTCSFRVFFVFMTAIFLRLSIAALLSLTPFPSFLFFPYRAFLLHLKGGPRVFSSANAHNRGYLYVIVVAYRPPASNVTVTGASSVRLRHRLRIYVRTYAQGIGSTYARRSVGVSFFNLLSELFLFALFPVSAPLIFGGNTPIFNLLSPPFFLLSPFFSCSKMSQVRYTN